MAGQETLVVKKLREYLETVRETASLEERRLRLMELVRILLGIPFADFEVENEVYVGRIYDLVGNLVFGVKASLHWQPKDDDLQLKCYLTDLDSRRPRTNYIAIVTDCLHFHVYRPQYDGTGRVEELEKIHGLNLASSMMTPEHAVRELGIILSHFRREPA